MSLDIIAIEQLLATYCHRIDRGTSAEVAVLFAEDAILRPFYDAHYEVRGRAAIEGWYRYYETHFKSKVRHLKHMTMSPLIEVSGAHASGSIYLIASGVNIDDDKAWMSTGTYFDTYVKADGQWRFATRHIEVEMMGTPTKAIEQFPPLGFPHGVPVK